jgi:hypothetical protein
MKLIYRILNLIPRIGADSRDADERRLQKALMEIWFVRGVSNHA